MNLGAKPRLGATRGKVGVPTPTFSSSRIVRASATEAPETSSVKSIDIETAKKVPTTRPLLPPFDAQKLANDLFGAPQARPGLSALFSMNDGVEGPRIYKPNLAGLVSEGGASTADIDADAINATNNATELPLLVYLPGIDGTGLAAWRQFPELSKNFDLRALYLPAEDRTGFEMLVKKVKAMLQKEIETSRPDRPIYLLGESFGALLALALANQMPDIDRVILVNPATGFAKSAWPRIGPLLTSLPETLYNTLPIALSPLIGNPIAMAMHGVRANQNLPNQASDFAYSLLDLIPELSMLRLVLPPATLSWRLRLLAQGAESANKNLNKVKQRCLLLVGELDLIVPNKDESKRLMKTLPRCQLRSLPRRTHAMLQESGVELMTILHEEGFYVPVRRMSNKRKTVEPSPPPPMSKKDNDDDDSSTGGPSSGPDSPPSSMAETVEDLSGAVDEAAKAASKAVDELAATASDAAEIATGDISAAFAGSTLEAVAHAHVEEHLHNSKDAVKEKRKPSGSNFGTAGPLEKPTRRETEIASESANLKLLRTLVSPIYLTTGEDGVTRKGLEGLPLDGRPVLFVGNHQLFAPDLPLMIEDFLTQKDTLLRGLTHPFALVTNENGEGAPFGRFLETYGATPVNGPNMYKLLSQSEAVLLYPGGAREAMKLKGEKYTIMWPETQEFVRMAARFNAIIVPFAAVGAEDGFNQVFDSKEMMELPIVGDYLKSQVPKDIPMARKGVNAGKIEEENWVMPFVTFNQPARFYYKFQKPVETDQSMLKDKDAAQAAYMGIKAQVEGGLAYLLEKREEDPYKDLAARLLYEATRGEQAPTFEI